MMLKTLVKSAISAFLLIIGLSVAGQNFLPGISYQAVVRDINGDELSNQSVTIEFAIRKNSLDGPVIFEESHNLIATNQFGLFSAVIGAGVNTGIGFFNSLSEIEWHTDDYFLEVRASIPGQGAPVLIGVSQLLAVPYSLYALKADTVLHEADGDPQNELIEDFSLDGNILSITESGTEFSVDLSQLITGGDMDTDPANELITELVATSENEISITEGGITNTYDVSPISYATWSKDNNAVYNTSQKIGIGTSAPSSTLQLDGSLAMKVVTINGALYDMTAAQPASENVSVFICNVTSQGVTVRLISAANCPGRMYKFRKFFSGSDTSNNVNILPVTGEMIDGISSYTMTHTQAEYLTIISNGSGWYVIDHSKE